jgi:hypothetical protein
LQQPPGGDAQAVTNADGQDAPNASAAAVDDTVHKWDKDKQQWENNRNLYDWRECTNLFPSKKVVVSGPDSGIVWHALTGDALQIDLPSSHVSGIALRSGLVVRILGVIPSIAYPTGTSTTSPMSAVSGAQVGVPYVVLKVILMTPRVVFFCCRTKQSNYEKQICCAILTTTTEIFNFGIKKKHSALFYRTSTSPMSRKNTASLPIRLASCSSSFLRPAFVMTVRGSFFSTTLTSPTGSQPCISSAWPCPRAMGHSPWIA